MINTSGHAKQAILPLSSLTSTLSWDAVPRAAGESGRLKDLLGDELDVVEVADVEDLQVEPPPMTIGMRSCTGFGSAGEFSRR